MHLPVSAGRCGLQQAIQVTSLHKLGAVDDFGRHPPWHHQSAVARVGGMVGKVGSEQFEEVGDYYTCLAEIGQQLVPVPHRQ